MYIHANIHPHLLVINLICLFEMSLSYVRDVMNMRLGELIIFLTNVITIIRMYVQYYKSPFIFFHHNSNLYSSSS